jgi:hypothetical protein
VQAVSLLSVLQLLLNVMAAAAAAGGGGFRRGSPCVVLAQGAHQDDGYQSCQEHDHHKAVKDGEPVDLQATMEQRMRYGARG